MRNIANITPKWEDIRNALIPNGSYLRSNADIPKLGENGQMEVNEDE